MAMRRSLVRCESSATYRQGAGLEGENFAQIHEAGGVDFQGFFVSAEVAEGLSWNVSGRGPPASI